jgi:hypothetical protein
MMKVHFDSVKGSIGLHVGAEGSVLRQTVKARANRIDVHYDVESQEEPAKVAGVLRNARNGCYVRQSVARPDLFNDTMTLNGKPFNLEDYPAPSGG